MNLEPHGIESLIDHAAQRLDGCRDLQSVVEVALACFRAVQSTPVIFRLGVLSTHFPARHRPTAREILALNLLGELTAGAIIRQRIRTSQHADHQMRIEESLAAVESSWKLLGGIRKKSARESFNLRSADNAGSESPSRGDCEWPLVGVRLDE
jgi:GAF domain-containing protein